jgi:prevent-host-death family protein
MQSVSATTLRRDLFRLIDEVLATGNPLTIEKSGRRVLLSPVDRTAAPGKLARLKKRTVLARGAGSLRDLVDVHPGEWRELDR